jgi:hypothetical protein
MTKRQSIQSDLAALESSARRLTNYLPRQWADIQMCRMFAAALVKYLKEKRAQRS